MLNIDRKLVAKFAAFHCEAMIRRIDSPRKTTLPNRAYFENKLRKLFPKRKGITLEQVILALPEDLDSLLAEMDRHAFKDLFEPTIRKGKKGRDIKKVKPATRQFLKLYGLLEAKRKYEVGIEKGEWSRHSFFTKLGYVSCPYCNRNTIQLIDLGGKTKQSAHLDHVIPKSIYPFFCISFYNLIPSCMVCNTLKNADDERIPNPYETKIKLSERFRFGIQVLTPRFPMRADSFKITYNTDPGIVKTKTQADQVEHFLDVFKIREQYNQHQDIAQEIVQRHFVFNDSYRAELMRRYGGVLFSSKGDLYRALHGRYMSDDEMHRRPLSKFIRDIQDHLEGRPAWLRPIPDKDIDRLKKKVEHSRNQP